MSWASRNGRKTLIGLVLVVMTAAALMLMPGASATGTPVNQLGLFELDTPNANTVDDPATAGEDWNDVYDCVVTPAHCSSYHFFSKTFIGASTEAAANDVTFFTGGGSKDTNDIPQWAWSPTDVSPDKNQILDAYGASYINPGNGHTIVYFGMDRFDTSGDSNVGFWFMRDHSFGLTGSSSTGGGFTGQHQDGDILVVSSFTTGGVTPTVDVYEWQGGSLHALTTGTGCASDVACATVNGDAGITVPWPYQDKAGDAAGSVPATAFFEGGVDLNNLLGTNDLPCFSNFLAETRSSQSANAQLKDLALGGLNSCGSLTITKTANPTDSQAGFNFTASGVDASVGNFALNGSNDGTGNVKTFSSIKPGAYTVAESGLPAHWSFGGFSCAPNGSATVDGQNAQQADITLGPGQNVSCTFTNNRQPQLTVIKHVINDNGGTATASSFTIGVSGTNASPNSFPGDEAGTLVALDAGSYSVTEGAHAGYDVSYSGDCSGTIAAGESKTCTVTNNDQAATLIVKKLVVNDNGGTKHATDFSFDVNGGSAIGFTQDGSDPLKGLNSLTVSAGTYNVVEDSTPIAGYTTTYSGCSNIALGLGQTATCTITNNDQAGTLIVKKLVINDNGGTKHATDFAFKVNGGSATSFTQDGSDPLKGLNSLTVNAGTYNVVEDATPIAGYDTTYDNCSGVVVANGATATCTITNNDQAGTLIVKKLVINDNGGTKHATDFAFKVNGGSATSFTQDGADPLKGLNSLTVDAGTYNVVEDATPIAGYSTSYDNCSNVHVANGATATCTITNNDQAGTLIVKKLVINDNGGTKHATDFAFKVNGGSATGFTQDGADPLKGLNSLTLNAGTYNVVEDATPIAGYSTSYDNCSDVVVPNGGTQTCTITNNDQAATLIVKKHVINDNGGTKVAGDFTLSVTGSSPSPASFKGDESGTSVGLNAGSYSVGEGTDPGYAASYSSDCTGSIALGETKTCTVTNDDIAPTLTLVKTVTNDNGGTELASAWTLTATGDGGFSGPGVQDSGQNQAVNGPNAVKAGVQYTLSEDGPSGYAPSTWDCSGTEPTGEGGNLVTLGLADTAVCTISNDDIRPQLTVIKHVINDNGGSAVAANFTMTVTGTNPSPASFPGSENGTAVGVEAGAYSVDEGSHSGYTETKSEGCSGTLSPGGTAVCTITNNDIASPPPPPPPPPPVVVPPAPQIDLQITKADSPDPDVLGNQLKYTITVKNNGPDTAHNVQMSDPLPAGVSFSSVSTTQGTCTGGQLISCQLGTIASGASVTITVFVKTLVTGIVVNTATTVGSEAEINTANNTATTTTLVKGPFQPPAIQKAATGCYAVAVSPHSLTAGKRSTLVLSVHMLGKPAKNARVRVTGAGVSKVSGPTNAKGIVRVSVKPAKPGILRFQPVAHSGCAVPRIGVIGAFTPPVTG
jgi:uncharacterized repeat protein (TIGR01451 family)